MESRLVGIGMSIGMGVIVGMGVIIAGVVDLAGHRQTEGSFPAPYSPKSHGMSRTM